MKGKGQAHQRNGQAKALNGVARKRVRKAGRTNDPPLAIRGTLDDVLRVATSGKPRGGK